MINLVPSVMEGSRKPYAITWSQYQGRETFILLNLVRNTQRFGVDSTYTNYTAISHDNIYGILLVVFCQNWSDSRPIGDLTEDIHGRIKIPEQENLLK